MKNLLFIICLALVSCGTLKNYDPQMKYNYMNNEYEQVPQDAELKYNYMEKKWEYVPK